MYRTLLLTILLNIIPPLWADTSNPYFGPNPVNQKTCIQENTADCVKVECGDGEPVDCQAQCQLDAVSKCLQLSTQNLPAS